MQDPSDPVAILIYMSGLAYVFSTRRRRRAKPCFEVRADTHINTRELAATYRDWAPLPKAAKQAIEVHNHVNIGNDKHATVAGMQPIFFDAGEPQTFKEYEGQERVIEKLHIQMQGVKQPEEIMRPQGFKGIAGLGKTLIAKVTAAEQRLRDERLGLKSGLWIECFPESFEDLDDIMALVLQHPRSQLFFDEIHQLSVADQHRLYEFLNNRRFQFKGHTQATLMPETLTMAATTDAGRLLLPLQRRFEWHDLRPMDRDAILTVLWKRTEMPYDGKAMELLADRTHFGGAPWEGLGLLSLAEASARSRNAACLEVRDVERIFTMEDLDEWGLRWADRQVIKALFKQPRMKAGELVCYGGNEGNTVSLAQIDVQTYREQVRPRLLSRQLVMVRPYYGQCLTDLAVSQYANLKAV